MVLAGVRTREAAERRRVFEGTLGPSRIYQKLNVGRDALARARQAGLTLLNDRR
jgi:hypothetical protein